MKAAIFRGPQQPLYIEEIQIDAPGPREVLVRTAAVGVCHSDLHFVDGLYPYPAPAVLGHEPAGVVEAVGEQVTYVQPGDHVIGCLSVFCGHCEYCLSAWETVCGSAQFGGYTVNGGFADYILADPNYVARIPKGLSAVNAAPIICAGVTTYKGIKEAATKPGDWVVVSGAGGLGHLAIQYARAMGLHVCAVDIDDNKLTHAQSMGADAIVNAKLPNAVELVKKVTDGGAHGVLITAPSLAAFKQGVAMTRKRGTCVLTGLPPGEFPFPLFDVVLNCITVRGSLVGTRQDMAEALAFAAEGKVKADIELQPLSAINQVLDRLERGEVAARVVLEFGVA